MKRLMAVLLPALLLAGCATTEITESLTAKIAVQQSTLRVIGDDLQRAVRVVAIVDDTRKYTKGAVTVNLLTEYVRDQIDWTELSLADAQLLALVLDEARDQLTLRVGEGVIDPDKMIVVNTLLDWVGDSARMVILMRGV